MLAAVWRGWWFSGLCSARAGSALGIHDLRHREEEWEKRRKKLPQEWQERHGSKWVVQGAWVGIIGGLMIMGVCLFRFFTA
jgi:hypothetical protein